MSRPREEDGGRALIPDRRVRCLACGGLGEEGFASSLRGGSFAGAALDARAEHHLDEPIRDHARATDRTVLSITHRLASVRRADRSYVLSGGRVTEHTATARS